MNKLQKIYYRSLMFTNILLILMLIFTLNRVEDLAATVNELTKTNTQEITIPVVSIIDDTTTIIPEEPLATEIQVATQLLPDTPIDKHELINSYVNDICLDYTNVEPSLVKSVIQHESEYNPNHKTGECIGLMQVSKRWHSDRAEKLGVTDFFVPYSNILLGIDYLSELTERYKDPALVLMLYNMKHDTAFKLYADGKISGYAESVLTMAEEYKKGE